MYSEIEDIVSLDVYRDGGSLSVTFLDPGHTRHEMVFRIDNAATAGSEGAKVYKAPLIKSIITATRKNPVTCVSSPETVVRNTPITWEKAAGILLGLKPLADNFVSDNNWVFQSMEQVAGCELGAVKQA